MTVSSSTSTQDFAGNGVTTLFDLPFRFYDNADIVAWLVDDAAGTFVVLSLGTHYTLFGAGMPEVDGNPVSQMTMLTAPPTGFTLIVSRIMSIQQITDIVNQGNFFPDVHENVFDRLTMYSQQLKEELDRCVKTLPTDLITPDELLESLRESEENAAASAAASAASAAASAGSASDAADILDEFDDRYLGAKNSDPTLDNDGDPLIDGALYWNSINSVMRAWSASSSVWIDLVTAIPFSVASGTSDALIADFAPNVALNNGTTVLVRASTENATTAPTLAVDGGPAKTITKQGASPLNPADIGGAGHWLLLTFDSLLDKWVLGNPAGAPFSTDGIAGSFSNLKASATGTNATVTVSADSVCVKNASNQQKVVNGVALSINSAAVGVNGLDTGVLAANTWYSKWVIYNPTTLAVAGLLSLSATAPTMPAGYTHKARIGWTRTDSTVNKYPLSYTQFGKSARYKVAAGTNMPALPFMISGVQGNTATPTWVAASSANFIPPTAGAISVLLHIGNSTAMVAPSNAYGSATSTVNPPPLVASAASGTFNLQGVFNVESSNIHFASDAAPGFVQCAGWEDNL